MMIVYSSQAAGSIVAQFQAYSSSHNVIDGYGVRTGTDDLQPPGLYANQSILNKSTVQKTSNFEICIQTFCKEGVTFKLTNDSLCL